LQGNQKPGTIDNPTSRVAFNPQHAHTDFLTSWFREDEGCELIRTSEGLVVDSESKCSVSGKRKYASEGEALATAAHQIATANAPKELRAYLCSWCDAWHLTKNAGSAGKDRR
jgi:hypothetical protein